MSSLSGQPAYVGLARLAAVKIGADNDETVRAILAQWSCEQPVPAPWPPPHNNPGNLTRLIGALGGPAPPVATAPPGTGLLYTYPSPEAGAIAYATYLLASSRYGAAIAAARNDDATGFLTAVSAGGYGTRLGCALGVLPTVTLPAPPAPPPHEVEPMIAAQVTEQWQPTQNATTGASNGVLRAVPDRGAPVVDRVPLGGAIVTVAEIITIPGPDGDWRLVKRPDRAVRYALRSDWVSDGFLP